jgi:branched-chain amino acid transport system substrate-binding protein
VLLIGLGVLLLILPACAPATAQPQGAPIRIGAPLSLTGSQAQDGQMVSDGYQFCQDWVNRQGGINLHGTWHRLDIIRKDDQSRVSVSAAVTERMIAADGIRLLLGPSSNATTARDAAIADAKQAVMVEGNGPSDAIFNQGYHSIFGVMAPTSRQMQGVIDLALAHSAVPKTLAILYADDSLSTEMANEARAYAAGRGLNVVYFDNFAGGSNNMAPQLAAAAVQQPDLIIEAGQLRDSVRTMQWVRGLNIRAKLFGFSEGPGTDGFVGDLQRIAENVIGASQWVAVARTEVSTFLTNQQYVTQFSASFGHAPDGRAAAATAACVALQAAIQRAGSADSASVRIALAGLDLNTFFGRITFDARGANLAKTVYVVQVRNGVSVVVWPAENATAKPRYPWPGWVT